MKPEPRDRFDNAAPFDQPQLPPAPTVNPLLKAALEVVRCARTQRLARGVMREFCRTHVEISKDSPFAAERRRQLSKALHVAHEAVDAATEAFEGDSVLWQEAQRILNA